MKRYLLTPVKMGNSSIDAKNTIKVNGHATFVFKLPNDLICTKHITLGIHKKVNLQIEWEVFTSENELLDSDFFLCKESYPTLVFDKPYLYNNTDCFLRIYLKNNSGRDIHIEGFTVEVYSSLNQNLKDQIKQYVEREKLDTFSFSCSDI